MLNPIDTAAVVRDGGAVGQYPGQIHEGVAWWLGACQVVTLRASRLAVAHDGHPLSATFADRLCSGAINAQHYACSVRHLGPQPEPDLLASMNDHHRAPGAWVSTEDAGGITTVRIRLYGPDGALLDDDTGLAAIRSLITEDRVPIPVNDQAKGTIEACHPLRSGGRP
ncbi:hypothetical protein ACIHFC_33320 [Streptomyces sp. NPDC052013]|uniref:hypothetical protein n=1 Tax=Streptomyces sp. NPDC052013 TaxID=3365679 RepID=UPI0037D8E857